MKLDFLTRDFLLESEPAKALYHLYAENAPIVDYHNHLSVTDICIDRQFKDIASFHEAIRKLMEAEDKKS